jgi:hypothetical protein
MSGIYITDGVRAKSILIHSLTFLSLRNNIISITRVGYSSFFSSANLVDVHEQLLIHLLLLLGVPLRLAARHRAVALQRCILKKGKTLNPGFSLDRL